MYFLSIYDGFGDFVTEVYLFLGSGVPEFMHR